MTTATAIDIANAKPAIVMMTVGITGEIAMGTVIMIIGIATAGITIGIATINGGLAYKRTVRKLSFE